ncbi:uncharacterized protein FOMMEDRAFT_158755 [Fomitiporia mediterranea MF3/22]|uniref:uncharacterized protein n=1 Tax=Fomitiporia mediterranea (strain MF3/22) TaxID=694068 RepID=UPI0004408C23|nr:uncharacterized protein FOMMEDRAFT_158755 [Fomitiporia mediterranea MF3/22]EJD01604.1 hypothetical protein FOMMEDRAFT_158755 [Fomitiporia mediterranea MF3/22]
MKRTLGAMLESDDDDEEPSMGRQTLPVANLPETFSDEPMNGLQYLFTVRRDAKRLPFITRAENPFQKQSAKVAVQEVVAGPSKPRVQLPSEEWRDVFIKRFRNFRKNSSQPTIGVAIPFPSTGNSKVMPEKKERDRWWDFINGKPECDWNSPKNKKLKNSRQILTESAQQRLHLNHNHINRDDVSQYEVPITENAIGETEVRETLVVNEFGEVEDEQADQSGIAEEMDISAEEDAAPLPTPLQTPQPESPHEPSKGEPGRRTGGPRHPTPALLRKMDSRYCVHLLMYFQHWLTQHLEHLESGSSTSSSHFAHLSQNHARWMFALLSRVDDQLSSDELSTLRSLARACIAFIKDLNKNNLNLVVSESSVGEAVEGSSGVRWIGDPGDAPMDERSCWMVVTIISDFWGQRDLWMDAESTLNG